MVFKLLTMLVFRVEKKLWRFFCTYAFRKIYPPDAFKKLAERVTKSFDNLPLGLRVVGSALRGKEEDEWEVLLDRLETSLDRDIEGALRVGYDSLHDDEQALFLHIAVFFNYKKDDEVMAMLADSNLNVKRGLKILADKSLIYKSSLGEIVMHKLLQQVGRQAIQRQEPWKRHILIDAHEICYVLENDDTERKAVLGILLDTSGINNVLINERALKRMCNLRFLHVYKTRNALPRTFHPEYLVELNLQKSHLEKLWQGTQPLTNLKKMDLARSYRLKELPDLSNATNFEHLELRYCESLVEIPSSVSELQKLESLSLLSCAKLEVVPTLINLASLDFVNMNGCSQLGSLPEISTNISTIIIDDTVVEEFPASFMRFTRLHTLLIVGSGNFKTLTHVPECVENLELMSTSIEKIPDWIKDLRVLRLTKGRRTIELTCSLVGKNGGFVNEVYNNFNLTEPSPGLQSEHLCLFPAHDLLDRRRCFELDSEISFEFSCTPSEDYEIVKCGVGIDSDDIDESDEDNYVDEILQCGDGIIYTDEIEQHSDWIVIQKKKLINIHAT
ncbi:hypothetical protein Bca101_067139 [Brassica carinata]